jgi:transcription termination factor NusG
MAKPNWYILKVRSGFAPVVAQKLRRLNLQTIIANPKSIRHRQTRFRKTYPQKLTLIDYVYCRFASKRHLDVMGIPGVVDVVGAPAPLDVDPLLVR